MRLVQAGTMLLGAVMYVLVIAFAGELSSSDHLYWIFFIVGFWNTLLIVVTYLVIVDSIRRVRDGDTLALATGGLVVKLVAIPFFLLNFFILAALGIGGLGIIIFGGVVLLFAAWIGAGLTYLTMLSTSIYVWAAIARLRRERIIGTGLATLYVVLSVVFVTDVVAGVLVFGHSRRRPGRALVSVLVVIGAVLIAISLIPAQSELMELFGLDLRYFAIVGGALLVATVAGTLLRVLIVRRRSARTSLAKAAVAEGAAPEGSRIGS